MFKIEKVRNNSWVAVIELIVYLQANYIYILLDHEIKDYFNHSLRKFAVLFFL